ncbi:MAG: VanZ family protein, partial [Candidatus Shapirobacteria bacterium]|nr:VanZ family protein [Candidatus Shapirobacteria bacterium]
MKKIIRFLPALIWMAVIFYFSSRQTTGIGGDSYWYRFLILKTFHLVEYAVLFILINFALNQNFYSIIAAYLYGISDEFHQSFTPGRLPKFTDTLIDLVGILIGFLAIKLIWPKIKNKFTS